MALVALVAALSGHADNLEQAAELVALLSTSRSPSRCGAVERAHLLHDLIEDRMKVASTDRTAHVCSRSAFHGAAGGA